MTAPHSSDLPAKPSWTPAQLEQLRDGDETQRARFFDVYFERVHALVSRRIAHRHQVEDLVQEIFLKLHRSLGSYDPERALDPWVTTIAMNTLRDHWRASSRREVPNELTPELQLQDEEVASPLAALERLELTDTLRAAIDRLSELSRRVLVSRAFEGAAFEEISRQVGRSEVAVRKRYSRAIESLRESMVTPSLS